jgi:hypothetical protein
MKKMNQLYKKIWIMIIPLILANCANADPSRSMSKNCSTNTPKQPVSFMFVVLDKNKNGLPINVITPAEPVNFVNFKNSKQKFNPKTLVGHETRQREKVCWRAVVKDLSSPSGYKLTDQEIALLWSPNQKIEFKKVIEMTIPNNNPVDIAYKYTIATKASNPKKGNTYLDPRMVVRIRR